MFVCVLVRVRVHTCRPLPGLGMRARFLIHSHSSETIASVKNKAFPVTLAYDALICFRLHEVVLYCIIFRYPPPSDQTSQPYTRTSHAYAHTYPMHALSLTHTHTHNLVVPMIKMTLLRHSYLHLVPKSMATHRFDTFRDSMTYWNKRTPLLPRAWGLADREEEECGTGRQR